jgi:hypothetical protein
MNKTTLEISVFSNDAGNVVFDIKDENSGSRFLEIEFTPQQFSWIMTNRCTPSIKATVNNLEKISKKRDQQQIEFEMPKSDLSDRIEVAKKHANIHIMEFYPGWELWDSFNTKNSFFYKNSVLWARCFIKRYIEPEAA